MEIIEFEASYERTVQLERFEPVRIAETVRVRVEEGDDLTEIRRELDAELRDSVERRIMRRLMQKKRAEGEADAADEDE